LTKPKARYTLGDLKKVQSLYPPSLQRQGFLRAAIAEGAPSPLLEREVLSYTESLKKTDG